MGKDKLGVSEFCLKKMLSPSSKERHEELFHGKHMLESTRKAVSTSKMGHHQNRNFWLQMMICTVSHLVFQRNTGEFLMPGFCFLFVLLGRWQDTMQSEEQLQNNKLSATQLGFEDLCFNSRGNPYHDSNCLGLKSHWLCARQSPKGTCFWADRPNASSQTELHLAWW